MPLIDCPFAKWPDGILRPTLPVRIINPHTNQSQDAYGLIDTGSDECAVPAYYAVTLGHDLLAGKQKQSNTGNGQTIVYEHTTRFEIFNPSGQIVFTINDTPIDFLPNLQIVLLGVKSFLSKFIVRIDYPHQMFSIRNPK
jgi:hypothetical protein